MIIPSLIILCGLGLIGTIIKHVSNQNKFKTFSIDIPTNNLTLTLLIDRNQISNVSHVYYKTIKFCSSNSDNLGYNINNIEHCIIPIVNQIMKNKKKKEKLLIHLDFYKDESINKIDENNFNSSIYNISNMDQSDISNVSDSPGFDNILESHINVNKGNENDKIQIELENDNKDESIYIIENNYNESNLDNLLTNNNTTTSSQNQSTIESEIRHIKLVINDIGYLFEYSSNDDPIESASQLAYEFCRRNGKLLGISPSSDLSNKELFDDNLMTQCIIPLKQKLIDDMNVPALV